MNKLGHLKFIIGNSPAELLADIQTIMMPAEIISIYAIGPKHIAWILTEAKLRRKNGRG